MLIVGRIYAHVTSIIHDVKLDHILASSKKSAQTLWQQFTMENCWLHMYETIENEKDKD
jgi:hypothetical protein